MKRQYTSFNHRSYPQTHWAQHIKQTPGFAFLVCFKMWVYDFSLFRIKAKAAVLSLENNNGLLFTHLFNRI